MRTLRERMSADSPPLRSAAARRNGRGGARENAAPAARSKLSAAYCRLRRRKSSPGYPFKTRRVVELWSRNGVYSAGEFQTYSRELNGRSRRLVRKDTLACVLIIVRAVVLASPFERVWRVEDMLRTTVSPFDKQNRDKTARTKAKRGKDGGKTKTFKNRPGAVGNVTVKFNLMRDVCVR